LFRVLRACAETADLPPEKRHPHVLKHSLASHLVAGNVNLALIRQALGHRSITSTMQYVGTSDGQAAEGAQAANDEAVLIRKQGQPSFRNRGSAIDCFSIGHLFRRGEKADGTEP
jgi:integrase/recombinase XerD